MRVQLNARVTSATLTLNTIHNIHSLIQGGYDKDDYDSHMTFGEPWGPKASLTFVLQILKTPEKSSPRNLVQIGDQTRDRCVTGAHATACSTAVDSY